MKNRIAFAIRAILVIAVFTCLTVMSASANEIEIASSTFKSSDHLHVAESILDVESLVNYTCETELGTPIACDGVNIIEYLPMAAYPEFNIQRVWVGGDIDNTIYVVSQVELDSCPSALELLNFTPENPEIGTPIFTDCFGMVEALFMRDYAGLNIQRHVSNLNEIEIYTITK